jgi:hypothetical protein
VLVLSLLGGLLAVLSVSGVEADTRNLLTANQHDFESGTGGWRSGARTSIRSERTVAAVGSRSMRLEASRRADSTASASTDGGQYGVSVTAGASYAGNVQVRSGGTRQRAVRCSLVWYKPNGALLATSDGAPVNEVAGSWVRPTCAAAAPTGAAFASLRVSVIGPAAGERHYVDDAWLVDTTAGGGGSTTTAPTVTSTTVPAAWSTRIASGAAADVRTPDGRVWSADRWFSGGTAYGEPESAIADTEDDVVYSTHRWGMAGYGIPVPGASNYRVRLHFAEIWHDGPGQRVFDVLAEGARKVDDLDLFATVGPDRALVREFDVHVADGTLNLGFEASAADPMVAAIEVIAASTTGTPTTSTTAPSTTAPPTTVAPTTTTTAPAPPPSGTAPAPGTVGFRGTTSSLRVIDGPEDAPAGTTWNTQYNYLEVTARDLTLDGVYVKGGIDFYGAGTLTVRNSIVEFGYGGWITILGRTSGSTMDVRDSTLRWRAGATPSVGAGNGAIQINASVTIVALRNDISGTADGIQAAGPNTRIEQNYIHHLATVGTYPDNTHNDGVQVYDGANMVIANNRIEIGFNGTHQNAALFFQPGSGNSIDVQIVGNYLQGGGFTLRLEGPTTARVRDNIFGPLEGGAWGDAYAWSPARTTEWLNNRHVDGSTVGDPEG